MITFLPECPGNDPSTPETADICTVALRGCAAANPPGGILYAIYRGIVTAGSTTWTQIGTRCAPPGRAPTAPVPGLTISQVQRLLLPAESARIQPPSGRRLINVPTNLTAPRPPRPPSPPSLIGLPVRVRVTPAHYEWLPIDGEAQVDSTPIGVTAIEARSHLVTG